MFIVANIVQPLIDINEAILKFWHGLGFSWGASIIGLTMVVRLAILPLTFKQVRSMQALQRLQPEMKKIQQRFKDDKQRQQQEMMQFYKDHEVNPLSSCLPLILQFPFFIGLYQTLRSTSFQNQVCPAPPHKACPDAEFLFIKSILEPATGAVLVALIITYVGTQLASSYVSSINIQDKNQKRLLFLFPFLFVPVVINFEAGLLIYWITTNTWTIGQQLFIRRFLPPPEPHIAGASAGGGGSDGGKAKPAGARAIASSGGGGGGGGKAKTVTEGNGGKPASRKGATKAKASSGAKSGGSGNGGGSDGGPRKAPPPSPRKKKKRSGRRR